MKPEIVFAVEPISYARLLVARANGEIKRVSAQPAQPASGPAADAVRSGMPMRVVDGVAIIEVIGEIVRSIDWFDQVEQDDIIKSVRAAVNDLEVGGIMMLFDSPGGSAMGLDDAAREIAAAAKAKTVTAVIKGQCFSAAYYLASQCSEVVSHGTSMVGSIGSIIALWDYSKLFATAGIKPVPIETAPLKHMGMMGTEITPEQQAELQRVVDFYGDDFKAAVKRGRGFSQKQLDAVANANFWPAPQALPLGLIDRIQTADQTFEQLRKLKPAASAGRARLSRAKIKAMDRR